MKTTVCSVLITFTSAAFAGVGTPVELKFPAGTSAMTAGRQTVAMNDSYLLVGLPYGDVKNSAGKLVAGAGEVQVFNAVTGALVRRLKHPQPTSGTKFGSQVVLSGNNAIVVNRNSRVNAMSLSTGAFLWTYSPMDDVGAFSLNDGFVDHVSADTGSVKIGMSSAWWIDYPGLGYYVGQGFTGQVLSSGAPASALFDSPAEKFAGFGASTAVSGGMTLVGVSRSDWGGLVDSGHASVFQGNQLIAHLAPPVSAADDQFGNAVAITSHHFIVSAPRVDFPGQANAGRLYVYDKTTFGFVRQVDCPAALGANAMFGLTLAAHGSMVAVGANGSAFVYDVVTGKLEQLAKPVGTGTGFGSSVSISGHSVVVADPAASGGTAATGRVFLYHGLSRQLPVSAVIAATKTAAPGAKSGTTFATLGSTAVSTTGAAMHLATITGGGATTANNAGVWSTQSMSLDLLLRESDLVGTAKMSAPVSPFFANDGTGRFMARNAATKQLTVFKDSGSTVAPLLAEGQSFLVNGASEIISKLHDVGGSTEASSQITVLASSKVGTGAITLANDSHVSRHIGSSLVSEVREGLVSPAAGLNYGQITPRFAVEGGRVALVAALSGAPTASNSALVVKSLGINNAWIMARKGDIAPGAGNAKFSAFISTAINSSETVFRATLSGGASGVTTGIWSTFLMNNDTQVGTVPVAIRLQQAGGTATGVKFSRFFEIAIASDGGIVFRAQIAGPGVNSTNDVGIWLYSQGVNYLLLREGSYVQGTNGPKIGTLQRWSLGKEGRYAVMASLTGTSSSANQGLLTGNFLSVFTANWSPSLVLQKGQLIDRPTAMPVKGMGMATNHFDASGSGSKGQATQVSAAGVLFSAIYTSNTDLLLLNP